MQAIPPILRPRSARRKPFRSRSTASGSLQTASLRSAFISNAKTSSGNYITRDQAIAAVQKYFADKGKTARVDRDVEWEDEGTGANKRYYYEVEAYVDGREYECYVDALTGDVRVKGELIESGTTLIGEESALSIALDHFSIAKNEARVVKVKLEEDDGLLIYEVEFKVKDLEYSFEIDAKTGKILDIDVSFD